jgi:hypothetical protein
MRTVMTQLGRALSPRAELISAVAFALWLGVPAGRGQTSADGGRPDAAVASLSPDPRPIRIWSREEYGGGPVVLSIARHPATGFVYLGTGAGVSEFDGARWLFIDPPDRAPTRGAVIDESGRVWTGSYNGAFLMRANAAGELCLGVQPEPMPPDLREIGYVRQIDNTPFGVCITARQDVIVLPPNGPARAWRASEPVSTTWWMEGALHVSIPTRGMFRLEPGGSLKRIDSAAPSVWAARETGEGRTLLLTAHGPLLWTGNPRRLETPPGYANFFAEAKPEVTTAAFLRDGRTAFTLESGDLGIFDSTGEPVLLWPRLPTLQFNNCRQMIEDDEGGLWLAKHAGVIRIQLDPVPPGAPPLRVLVRRVLDGAGRVIYSASAGRPPPVPVAVPVDTDALRVQFAAPSFRHEHQGGRPMEFRSRLAGVEPDWTAWTTRAERAFAGLPYRELLLEVQARRPGEAETAATSLVVRLSRVWWRTPWALALFVGGGGLAWLGAHRLGTRALRRRAARLEAQVAARTLELAEKNAALRAQNSELAQLRKLDLNEKAAAHLAEEKARLEVLRYQLNPHFLYNALNSVYSLVLTAPPAAANMVLRLADFCRVALERQDTETTTVGAEFDKLTTYLEIEKVRWGDSLHLAIEAGADVRAATIPQFLLLPLVENAIKYGGATSPEELRVRVAASLEPDGSLLLVVANSGTWVGPNTAPTVKSSGIGLANLRQRLQRHYPNAHSLTIEHGEGWVTVKVRISSRVAVQETPGAGQGI